MATLILLALLAQQSYPQEAAPLTPPTSLLWVEVVPDTIPVRDPSQQIDVLYVVASSYTTSQATADTICAQALAKGNEVLANDPANISRLNLVACKLVTWTSVSDTGDLSAITNTGGALYPQVNAWRTQYGADLVQMIGTFTNSCGLGYQCPFDSMFGYSVVQASCAVSNYSSVHELGHNVCLAHDINNQTPTYSYGSGFCDPAGRRDPMSYSTSASSPNPCTGSRVSYHGNPNISPFGAPFGTALNYNNARVWREQAARVAAWYSPVTPPVCGTIILSPGTVGNGYTNRSYSQSFTATGGTGPYTFTVSAGTLPTGITLSSPTISGTPTVAGVSTFTLKATDSSINHCTGTTTYNLTVLQLPSAPTNLVPFLPPPPD